MTEQIKEDLLGHDGLGEGFQTTPLTDFRGRLVDFDIDTRFSRTTVQLKFTDVEVIESREPYNFPVAQIDIRYSDRKRSKWGIYQKSIKDLLAGAPITKFQPLFDQHLVDKMQRMTLTPGHDLGFKDRETGEDVIVDAWTLTELEGAGVTEQTPLDIALDLANGKTVPEFNTAALKNPGIKGTAIQTDILNNTFIQRMLDEGLLTEDKDGILHTTA